jgi:tRNA (mo5U34)-methyltransferase
MSTLLPPRKPVDLDLAQLFAGVHWHQKWELFEGVFTPGHNPVVDLLRYAGVPDDLTGKSVLDIGAWNSCFSAECVRRGAGRVVGLGPDNPEFAGFDRIKQVLGYDNMEYRYGSVYDMDRAELGEFDIVLCFGVLYHLRYPLLALDKIYEVCREQLFVESFVIDQHFLLGAGHRPVPLEEVNPELKGTSLWQFFPGTELGNDPSNWFGPNLTGLVDAVGSAGFHVTHTQAWGDRAALAARRGERPFSNDNTYDRLAVVARSIGLSTPSAE